MSPTGSRRRSSHLRLFADDEGKTNRSLPDVDGEVLVVSQFTLYADLRKGRRPSWGDAEDPGSPPNAWRRSRRRSRPDGRAWSARGVRRDDGRRAAERRAVHARDRRLVPQLDVGRPDPRARIDRAGLFAEPRGRASPGCEPPIGRGDRSCEGTSPRAIATGAPAGRSRASGPVAAPPEYLRPSGVMRCQEASRSASVRSASNRSPSSLWIGIARSRWCRSQRSSRSSDHRQKPQSRRRARRVVPSPQLRVVDPNAWLGGAVGSPGTMREMYLDVFDRNPFGTNCWLLAADG